MLPAGEIPASERGTSRPTENRALGSWRQRHELSVGTSDERAVTVGTHRRGFGIGPTPPVESESERFRCVRQMPSHYVMTLGIKRQFQHGDPNSQN
jgi:hypothetical protein